MISKQRSSTEATIRDLLTAQHGVDEAEITSNANLFTDLGLDSLDKMEFMMQLEEKFKIEIDDLEFDELETVQQVVAFMESKK